MIATDSQSVILNYAEVLGLFGSFKFDQNKINLVHAPNLLSCEEMK